MADADLQQVIDAWKIFEGAVTRDELCAVHEATLTTPRSAEPDIELQSVAMREAGIGGSTEILT